MPVSYLSQAKANHHAKARLLASGRTVADVARLVDASEKQLNRLLADPSFRALVSNYRVADNAKEASTRFNLLARAA